MNHRHWRIELYETDTAFHIVIDGLEKGEAWGFSPQEAYESALEKMTIKPWLVNDQSPRHETSQILDTIKSGFAGVLPTGRIVDRRAHPEAMPIQKNELLGVPEPRN